jgi:thioredoxin 1
MRYFQLIYICLLLTLTCAVPRDVQGQILYFEGTFDQALEASKRSKKPLMIEFSAPWCQPCQKLEKETLSNIDVALQVNNEFVAVRVDVDTFEGMDLAEQWLVGVYPTVIFLDNRGRYVARTKGFYGPSLFRRAMDIFGERSGMKKVVDDEDKSFIISLSSL